MISISDVLSFMRWNGFPCLWSKQSLAGFSISFACQSEPCFSYFALASQNLRFKNPPLIHVHLKFWIGFLYHWNNFCQDKDQNFYRLEKISKIYKVLSKDNLGISSIFEILEEFFVMRISSESEEVEIHSVGIFPFFIFLCIKKMGHVTRYVCARIRVFLIHESVCWRYFLVLTFAWNSFWSTCQFHFQTYFWSNSVKCLAQKFIRGSFLYIIYYQHKNIFMYQKTIHEIDLISSKLLCFWVYVLLSEFALGMTSSRARLEMK